MDRLGGLIEGISRSTSELYKVPIAIAAVLLALAWGYLPPLRRMQALVALTLIACLNYGRWGTETLLQRVDTYDLVHYYLNAKYFDELGYYDLYPAVILADHENGGPVYPLPGMYLAQDDTGHHREPIQHALDRGLVVKQERFTPERWASFTHDSLHLQREVEGFQKQPKLWAEMIQDHGFNGTPAWTAVAKPIASAVPVEAVKWLGFIDLALLAAAIGVVGWAYGAEGALWATLFLAVTYSTRWPTITWAFLRYDWIAALMAATALLRKEKHLAAGLLTGWAGASRLFPALWLWGPAFKGLAGLTRRVVSRPLLTLAGGALLGAAVSIGAAVAIHGPEPVRIHLANMEDHNSAEQLSSRRVGLAQAISWDGGLEPKLITNERRALIGEQAPLRYGLAAAWLVAMGVAMRKLRDDETFGFGFLPFFLVTTASYYYYVARATLIVIHAGGLDRWRNRVGLAMLLALEAFSNGSEVWLPGYRMFLIGGLAWGLCAYALVMGVWIAWESWREASAAPEPAGAKPARKARKKKPA